MKKKHIFLISFVVLLLIPFSVEAEGDANGWQDDTIYYILVDRFMNGTTENDYDINTSNPNMYYGGDFRGISQKLDYIKQLGFTAINLSPIMSNEANGYHGFWIDNYTAVEEHFGTVEDLQLLVKQAHEKEMKVILDFVVTHVGKNHSWTTNNEDWISGLTTNQWGEDLPVPNLNKPEVANYIKDSATYWVEETDIDGIRLYVDENTPIPFIQTFSQHLTTKKEDFLVLVDAPGEIDKEELPDATVLNRAMGEKVSEILRDAELGLHPLIEASQSDVNIANVIDSVDTIRFSREAVKLAQHPITRYKLALTYLYTMPGIPIVYQGTEIPMDNGQDIPDHQMMQLNNGEDELKQYMEQLAAIRKEFPAITDGNLELIGSDGAMSVYKRTYQDETVYVAINNDTTTRTIKLDDIPSHMQLTGLIQDNIVRADNQGYYQLILDRETADVFVVEEDTGFNWLFIGMMIIVLGGFVVIVIMLSMKSRQTKK